MIPAIITHLGGHEYPALAVQSCNRVGVIPYFIGNVPPKSGRFSYVEYEAHRNAAAEFNRNFKHSTGNTPNFERLCFERWFVINSFLKARGIPRAMCIDSDVLLFATPDRIQELAGDGYDVITTGVPVELGGFTYTLGHAIMSAESVQAMCEYCKSGDRGNDMSAFTQCAEKNGLKVFSFEQPSNGYAMDHHIAYTDGWEKMPGIRHGFDVKRLTYSAGVPFCNNRKSGNARMLSLHFWCFHKPLMQTVWRACCES